MRNNKKIIPFYKIYSVISSFKDKNTVLVGGCFDVFHYGHLKFLTRAKKEGDYLIVALESDKFIQIKKNRLPIHNQKQRAEILSSIFFVDLVILLPYFSTYENYLDLVKKVSPKIIAVTKGDLQIKNKKKQALTIGAKVKAVTTLVKNFSSTKILKF